MLLRVVFAVLWVFIGSFTDIEYSLFFYSFKHCAENCPSPYCRLFYGFEPVRCPTYCLDDRALRRYIHSIPLQYTTSPRQWSVELAVADVLIELLNLTVVMLNDVRNAYHDYSGCREALYIWKVKSIDSNEQGFEIKDGFEQRQRG